MRLYDDDYKFKKYIEMMNCGFNHEHVLRFGIFGILTRLMTCLIQIYTIPMMEKARVVENKVH